MDATPTPSTARLMPMVPTVSQYILSMLFRTILTHAGAIIALVVTIIFASNAGTLLKAPVNLIVVILAFSIALVLAVWDIYKVATNRPRRFTGKYREAKIREFMIRIISGDGRCVMSSNDLSWVKDEAVDALMSKARKSSLDLIMPSRTVLSQKLVDAGARAHYYSDNDFKFKSRFTIVNVGRADAWVAVGMGTEKAHMVRIVSSNDDPFFHIAKDLVALAERTAKMVSA